MAWTVPPVLTAGTEWDYADFQTYVLDNLQAIYDQVTSEGFGLSGDANDVFVGSSDNTAVALELGDGDLLIGGSSGVEVLDAAGRGVFVLQCNGGTVSWVEPDWAALFEEVLRGV